ncbi:hypothetical protein F5X99DRAFT_388501 [Biscogniauxia marginata]|nr:hypothetical protein F5X99DRAFT_388501 [Biscogniauxia marginata]
MDSLSQARARELVQEIAAENGYLSDDVLETLLPRARRDVDAMTHRFHRIVGSSVITLAQNLYTSNARFVFELLHNADDNHFSRARARNEVPYITFRVAPQHIVVECNEDGFSPENLKAICDIGKSSKTGAQGYIGEKGIGFKSVFMVAYKAHIQSGDFSFSFNHRPGQTGVGMITPVWEDTHDRPPDDITRIKLFLHDDGDAASLDARRRLIIEQFEDIQGNCLLFLKNIGCINVIFLDADNQETSSVRYSTRSSSSTPHRISLIKSRDGGVSEEVSSYHVTKYLAHNLSRSENRTYTEAEEAAKVWGTSQVILAFQLDVAGLEPVIQSQQVFAFLPIRTMGFKFLIQADFVTQANRQDIITTSNRNQSLLEGIAQAFGIAIQELCTDDHLQYNWMRYLPQKDDFPWDRYWLSLINRIKSEIATVPVMRPRSEGSLRLIRDVRELGHTMIYKDKPLFNDIETEMYLSQCYDAADLHMLHEFGLEVMDMPLILDRVEADLVHPRSKIKSASTSDQWHTAAAKLLSLPFEDYRFIDRKLCLYMVQSLELIPLQNQTWVSCENAVNPLTFPTVSGVMIPSDLKLSLIDASAVLNATRAKLFKHLGATQASVSQVRELVFKHYQNLPLGHSPYPVEPALAHLEFLYRTHTPKSGDFTQYQHVAVLTEKRILKKPRSQDVYISDDCPFGARNILKEVTDSSEPSFSAPGFPVDFLLPVYLDGPDSQQTSEENKAWIDWLQNTLGVRTRLRLIDNDSVTDLFRYIIDYRTDALLGVLQDYWNVLNPAISGNRSIKNDIETILIPYGGKESTRLSSAYLPIPYLKSRCLQYIDDVSLFPFLDLTNTLAPDDLNAWEFLHDVFGVGKSDDLNFYLDILQILKQHSVGSDESRRQRIFDLYRQIYTKIINTDESTKSQDLARVKSSFHADRFVFLPGVRSWVKPSSCRWDAPREMRTLYGLAWYYKPFFAEDPTLEATLTPFLRNSVGVTDLSWIDIIKEINMQIEGESPDAYTIYLMYDLLAGLESKVPEYERKTIKDSFQQEPLIYAAGEWHAVLACLWSSATTIPGKTTLNSQYPEMKTFFVDFLGVETLTLDMVYEELKRKGSISSCASISEVKQELCQFSFLLSASKNTPDPKPILDGRVFPVRFPNGEVQLLDTSTDFAIVDRKPLGEKFGSRAKMLDFTLDEVRCLQPFLQWAGLDGRRLSVKVTEVTAPIGNGEYSVQESCRNIKSRAHALCRVATHFESPRALVDPMAFFQLIKRSTVLETDGIRSELHLLEDGCTLKVIQSQSELHMETTEDTLRIYVPKDAQRQDICFVYSLPHALFKWMMDESVSTVSTGERERATRLIFSILVTNPSSLGSILDMEGVVELDFPDESTNIDIQDEQNRSASPEVIIQKSVSSHATIQDQRPVTPVSLEDDDDSAGTESPISSTSSAADPSTPKHVFYPTWYMTPESNPSHQSSSSSISSAESVYHSPLPSPPLWSPPLATPSQPSAPRGLEDISLLERAIYVSLLGKVIQAARNVHLLRKGAFDLTALRVALSEIDESHDSTDDNFRMCSTSQIVRDEMIRAAGELFVFELLSHLNPRLPHVSREIWQSTIRKYVTVHPDYADMLPWNGQEMADIIYTDSDSALTNAFIENGYLRRSIWEGRKPTYYIEVKTTTGPCQTPFFLSKPQYKRMQDRSNGLTRTENPETIYVVFRVFNLGRDSIDFSIYVDPHFMKEQGSLKFTAETWSVVPTSLAF